jgi:hypothetical protein
MVSRKGRFPCFSLPQTGGRSRRTPASRYGFWRDDGSGLRSAPGLGRGRDAPNLAADQETDEDDPPGQQKSRPLEGDRLLSTGTPEPGPTGQAPTPRGKSICGQASRKPGPAPVKLPRFSRAPGALPRGPRPPEHTSPEHTWPERRSADGTSSGLAAGNGRSWGGRWAERRSPARRAPGRTCPDGRSWHAADPSAPGTSSACTCPGRRFPVHKAPAHRSPGRTCPDGTSWHAAETTARGKSSARRSPARKAPAHTFRAHMFWVGMSWHAADKADRTSARK